MNGLTRICTAALTLMLAACGGGGSDSPIIATRATITSANAPAVTGAVLTSTLEGADLGTFADFGPTVSPVGTPKTRALAKATAPRLAEAATLLENSQIGILQTPIGPVSESCGGGGSLTISGELADDSTLTAGDTIVFEFEDCIEGDTVIDGRFAMTISSFSGDFVGGSFVFGVAVELTAFSVVEDGESATVGGDISVSVDTTASPTLTVVVSSTELAVSASGASHTLSGFSSTRSFDTVAGSYSLVASGSLTSSDFSGTVDFETTASLQGIGAAHAGSGELLITGANGATIRVTVLDGTHLRLEIDTNGDGTVDETIDRTWDQLV